MSSVAVAFLAVAVPSRAARWLGRIGPDGLSWCAQVIEWVTGNSIDAGPAIDPLARRVMRRKG